MPKFTRAPNHHRYSNPIEVPVTLPPASGMTYYNSRPPMAAYYEVPTSAPQATMPVSSYDQFVVTPLTIPPTATGATAGGPVGGAAVQAQHRASSGAWTMQDDHTLLAARAAGQNWGQIQSNYFQTKTGNACRKRHERLIERKGADDWDTRKLERLSREYMTMRKEIWQPLAQRCGERWNVVEQKVFPPHHPNGYKKRRETDRSVPCSACRTD